MTDPSTSPTACRLADGILVINLKHRPERLEHFEQMARPIRVLQGWQRIDAVHGVDLPGFDQLPWFRQRARDKCWAGRAGCTLSHRKAIEYANNQGWNSVLILEDDIQLGAAFESRVNDYLTATARHSAEWGACFLGLSKPVGPSRKLQDLAHCRAVYDIFGCIGAFAYILHRETFDWLLAELPTEQNIWPWISRHRAIDRWYARNLTRRFKVHAVSPNLIGHYSSFSDIGQRAGADLLIEEAATGAHEQLRSCGRLAFGLRAGLLHVRFGFTKLANRIQGALKRQRGF